MFTGLVAELGEIVALTRKGAGARLSLSARDVAQGAVLGDSISVNGTCLTVVDITGETLSFDASDETLKTTNLGQLRAKDRVNLEPALKADSRLGGHFVTGHIDGVGSIRSRTVSGETCRIVINAGKEIVDYLVEKGSVAVDGISLTVVDVLRDGFSIVIIPHTSRMTTIGFKGVGDSVNIEVDILGKYVSKFLNKNSDSRLMQTLSEQGYV